MQKLKNILLEQLKAHPDAGIRDAAKLIYQNEFGGGHLIADRDAALERLRRELDVCPDTDAPLFEPIGNGMARLNLRPASGRLSTDTIFRIFYLSSQGVKGSPEGLLKKLRLLYELGFDSRDVDAFLEKYTLDGCPMLSHSEGYRAAYAPAYRVVDERYMKYVDVFSAIDRLSRFAGPVIVAVDGMCASGKSTLAGMLAEVYDANVFHADDYFLPAEKRTAERLAQPGGNMDRERLSDEILIPLSRGETPVTRRFDCRSMSLEPPEKRRYSRINIVEGSYCLHPELQDFYTLKLALRTTPERQLERLRRRDPQSVPAFVSRWIPMEISYIQATDLYARAQMVFDT